MRADRLKFLVRSSWEYYRNAKTIYDIDSPFLFQLTQSLFDRDIQPIIFQKIEARRKELKKDPTVFVKKDLGQGSLHFALKSAKIRLSSWVSHSSISPYYGRILHRLVCHLQPKVILELGTAAGISGAYLASGICSGNFITVEADPMAVQVAKKTFEKLSIDIARIEEGAFDEKLDYLLAAYTPQLIFIDGNHQSEALKKYMESFEAHGPGKLAAIVVDDIRWSEDMYMAWQALANDPKWQVSIDLFRLGILIRNIDLKEHQTYKIIETKFKPWRIGLFR